ncbi:3-demethylubiquinone-9 3-O-methyltransferase [Elsinoe australis]|uniref:3-demethylubiquinone-9 3-O-methyltransferase n=1 Tax=Elsinoe australis TaxID=40998 RepID=A0A2P7Z1E7_9PEZI|nr:3-demethylubiquinone-9 3-O-methyltransferase [Elsinoe australis]
MSRAFPSPPAAKHVYQAADTKRAEGTWPDDPFAFDTLNDAEIFDSFTQDQLTDLDPGVFVVSNNSSTLPDNNGATNSVSSHHSDLQDPFDVAFRGNWPTVQEPQLSIDTTTVSPIDFIQPMRSPLPRSLPRRRSKNTLRQRSRSGTRPIAIPAPYTANSAPQSLAMQRWRDSLPEDEAASFTAITNALQWQDGNLAQEHTRSTACPALESRAPSSTTSIDSEFSATSTHSGQSTHFRNGKTMADWTGEYEFEAHVAACVKDALPPYLVAYEAQSLVPYSATSGWTKDHYTQVSSQIASRANPTGLPGTFPLIAQQEMDGSDSTAESISGLQGQDTEHVQSSRQQKDMGSFAQILALHLGRFAREQVAAGVFPSDELFQREARRVLYGDEDEWNQSIADNSIWLDHIRRQND